MIRHVSEAGARAPGALRAVLIAVALTTAAVIPARSQTPCGPGPVPRILEQLQTLARTPDPAARRAAVARLLDRWAAGKAIARTALHARWKTLAAADRERLADLLRRLAAARASAALARDGVGAFAMLDARRIAPSDCLVASRVAGGRGRERIVHWRMRTAPEGPRFVDLLVDGVSLTRNLRDELDSILRANEGDVADLTARLRTIVARLEREGR